jgi:hypothetical protein
MLDRATSGAVYGRDEQDALAALGELAADDHKQDEPDALAALNELSSAGMWSREEIVLRKRKRGVRR